MANIDKAREEVMQVTNKLVANGHINKQIFKDLEYIEKNIQKPEVLNYVEQLVNKPVTSKRTSIANGYDRINDLSYYINNIDNKLKTSYYMDFQNYLKSLLNTIPNDRITYRGNNYKLDDLHNIKEVSKTTYLKDFTISIDNGIYRLYDNDFLSMLSLDNYTEKYVQAIKNKDTSFKSDTRTRIGKLYSFFKTLYIRCENARNAQNYIKNKVNITLKGKEGENLQFVDTDELVLGELDHRNSIVNIEYGIYSQNGSRVGGLYEGTYLFYDLVKNYQFINTVDKNNFFTFRNSIPKILLELGKTYDVTYSSDSPKYENAPLRIVFSNFKVANKKESKKSDPIPVCNSYNEFMDVFESFYDNREMFKLKN